MAILLSTIRHRVNAKLRNTDDRRASYDPVEIDQTIAEKYLARSAGLPAFHVLTLNAFTIGPSASTFVLPTAGAAEYAGDVQIQLVSTGQWLRKVSVEEMDAFRGYQTAAQLIQGAAIPWIFALYEESDQEVQGLVYPAAKGAEVCNLYAQMVNVDLRATPLDTVSVAMGRYAATGLVFDVAAELLEAMSEEDVKLRRLNRNVADSWRKEARDAFYQEEVRRHDMEGHGRTMRNVP